MNKKYNLKLDLQFRCNNSIMKFNQFDNNTSDFFMRITNGGNLVDIEKAIVVLAIIKPSGKVASQFVEVENGLVYADLKPNMKDEIGTYTAKAMLILEDKKVVTNVISYEVEEDKIFSLLNDSAEDTEEFTLLTDMLSRLSAIEISEEQRMINEAERILSEENRKIEEAKRVEAELIRQHEEADRAKYDATRESNENVRKQNESIRLANETNRIDEEAKRVEEETKRVEAEQLRKDNYNFMTEDEERRRLEANAHKEAEALRVQAETNRVNEEAKRRTTEQARVSAENTRVSNENTRKSNEIFRENNETQRIEAETQRQSRYNSFIADAEANANNFENYTNAAKVKEEERKSNELDRKSQEARRVSNEVERISNENTRKANEKAREKNETSRQYVFENKVNEVDEKIIEINTTKDNFVSSINTKVDNKISELDNAKSDMTTTVSNKVNEVENRFNALTSSQQQDAEVIDARDGETSLKARLDRDIEKAKQVYVNVEGSNISTDSSSGYAKDVEILGNTIQSASNLADIRSVGDKVEGQELYEIPVVSCGKNLFDQSNIIKSYYWSSEDTHVPYANSYLSEKYYRVKPNTKLITNHPTGSVQIMSYDKNKKFIGRVSISSKTVYTVPGDVHYLRFSVYNNALDFKLQIEEGTQITPYEPYIEDKLTILSPVQLEKVGDVADRIIEKNGVCGVEKNVIDYVPKINYASDIKAYNNIESSLYRGFFVYFDDVNITNFANKPNVISNYFSPCGDKNNITSGLTNGCIGGFDHNAGRYYIAFSILKSELSESTNTGVFEWFKNKEDLFFKIQLATPQFIPLPHDQQVKLRTFANKTNISFLTEIEGTIKAQVPKSLGATVNTHTEQINNLNKELDRVKKLEESTISTVTTESDFTTIEATSNGYFEDVKLEGKTLVNLIKDGNIQKNLGKGNTTLAKYSYNRILDVDKLYTFICKVSNVEESRDDRPAISFNSGMNGSGIRLNNGMNIFTFKNNVNLTSGNQLWIFYSNSSSVTSTDPQIDYIYILEGDHTHNPPSYFEGLKSVGQNVDEVSVESVNGDGNLFGFEVKKFNCSSTSMWYDVQGVPNMYSDMSKKTQCQVYLPDGTYTFGYDGVNSINVAKFQLVSIDDKVVVNVNSVDNFKTTRFLNEGVYTVRVVGASVGDILVKDVQILKGTTPKPYSPHQSDKKRLLYYNEETQAWEKPILREWDSIEKHANGKYYYHQRSGEVVLNGSENWNNDTNSSTISPATYRQSIQFNAIGIPSASFNTKTSPNIISDLLPTVIFGDVYSYNHIGISISGTGSIGTHIIINNNFTDVTELKQWLQANNLTLVYQLAQEKVYECTNIDLITYANETNYVVESGAIVPRTTLKVHNNISNVVSLLQKKVSLLESNVKASQEVQDMMILETDMRMLDIELALMDFMPMKLNLGGSNMLRSATYFNFLKNHIINETYEKEYLENVMNKYLATGRINQDEYNELYKMLYPPVYDIELPIEY